jgi:hypothetical protein
MAFSSLRTASAGIALLALAAWTAAPGRSAPPSAQKLPAALQAIRADSLKGHVSFLASDLLEGRNTPSRGLDLAAEYLASQFRRAGLEPLGVDGYFQTAPYRIRESNTDSLSLRLEISGQSIEVKPGQVALRTDRAFDLSGASAVKVEVTDLSPLKDLPAEALRGRAVLTRLPNRPTDPAEAQRLFRAQQAFYARLQQLQPAAILSLQPAITAVASPGRLIDPDSPAPPRADSGPPILLVGNPELSRLYDALAPGTGSATVTLHAEGPVEKPVRLRNVVAILRGSDSALRNTYVLISGHYDHLGTLPPGEGDRIFNGANDDASGTVAMLEIASALAAAPVRPRRSLVFAAWFGEEKGLLGSRYYGRHPLVPVDKTVAMLNLEQVGRTDDSEGPQVARVAVTGFDYSTVGEALRAAGARLGVTVFKHPTNSDAYFARSDNQALADLGVPAHTLSVAYEFPDYHGVGDEWQKLDYANMERITRTAALAALTIADDPKEPRWSAAVPKAGKYLEAWKEHHPGSQAGTTPPAGRPSPTAPAKQSGTGASARSFPATG